MMQRGRTWALSVLASACSGGTPAVVHEKAATTQPASATTAAKPEPAKPEPAKPEPAKPEIDPTLAIVCKAFDDTVAEGKGDAQLLARTAVRTTERGLTEAQLAELGALPADLLASIHKRGNPPECAPLVKYLEAAK